MDKKEKDELRETSNLIRATEGELNDLKHDIDKIEKENGQTESEIRQTKKDYEKIRIVIEDLGRKHEENARRLYEKKDEENLKKKELNVLLAKRDQIKSGKTPNPNEIF